MRYGVLGLVGALVLGGCQATPSTGELTDSQRSKLEEQVNDAIGSLYEAMNAHDPDRVLGHFARGDTFVYVGCTSFRVGYESLEQRERDWERTAPDSLQFAYKIVATRVLDPEVAAVAARGTLGDSPLYWTYVLRKTDGDWKVVYEHESWPGCPAESRHPTGEQLEGG